MGENLISGKVAVVTGATLGIGRAIAEALLVEGAEVVICARRGDEVRRAVEEMSTFGGQIRGMACDVRKYDQVDSLMRFAAEPSGGVDILVNNAGVGIFGHISQLAPADWHEVIDTNLTGVFYCCHAALPYLRKRGGGHIFNMSSLAGKEAFEGGSAYNASKGGVVLLTRNLAIDYGRRGIRVNCLCPGLIETAMTSAVFQPGMEKMLSRFVDAHQLGRAGQPAEVAAAALFLASDDASFVTGHALVVDGGFTAGHRVGVAELLGLD